MNEKSFVEGPTRSTLRSLRDSMLNTGTGLYQLLILVLHASCLSSQWKYSKDLKWLRDLVGLCVCVIACLSVGHVREPCENGSTDRDAVWKAEMGGPK